MKPLGKIPALWTAKTAYAIGLIATDGSLSPDKRHIILVSRDRDQIVTFKRCLNLTNKIGMRVGGYTSRKEYYHVQFGDVVFYRWLETIGLTANKSKTIGTLRIPRDYFFDFLRGHFDGDGSCFSYLDPRWKNSFMFYIAFNSASQNHVEWIREKLRALAKIGGHITKNRSASFWQLKYAKKEAKILIQHLYYRKNLPHLKRKFQKLQHILQIDNKINADVAELADAHL